MVKAELSKQVPAGLVKLAEECEYEFGHTWQVAFLCERLFDELQSLHALDQKARDYLLNAALIHDIGWVHGGKGHHKTSYELVVANRPEDVSVDDAEIIGQIGRYHRKAHPSIDHAPFARLNSMERQLITKLAALLRIADGLDRGHANRIQDLYVGIANNGVDIFLKTNGPAELEIWGAQRKSALFEDVYKHKITFITKL